jgi:fimbrial chaperone protein
MPRPSRLLLLFLSGIILVTPAAARFDASVSPPRFELTAKPGDVIRQVVNISNGAREPARYTVKTADWDVDAQGRVQYQEGAPSPGSCRPWVKIERHEISVGPEGSRPFRFEVHVPANAPRAECRFALLIAGAATQITPSTGSQAIQMPIVGRLGVVAYIAVGGARADLRLASLAIQKIDNRHVPIATFYNQGDAHGRIAGSLEAKDAAGRAVELVAQQSAIMPKGRMAIRLVPVDYSSGEPRVPSFDLAPPMHVRGTLQFLGGGEVKIDQVLR